MAHLIDKSALAAEIEKYISSYKGILNKVDKLSDNSEDWLDSTLMLESKIDLLQHILSFLDTLKVKEVDLELITGWFDHVAQMADDRKTLNGEVMEDWAALDEIKCLAKNSSEFITKHYKTQKEE